MYEAQGNFMLRVPNNNEAYSQAKALLDPALADEVGKELMSMVYDKGAKYIIKGLDSNWGFIDVVKIFKTIRWEGRPERFMKSFSRDTNNLVVFASQKPPQINFKYAGTDKWATIVDYIPE